jgi:hypothetical protein
MVNATLGFPLAPASELLEETSVFIRGKRKMKRTNSWCISAKRSIVLEPVLQQKLNKQVIISSRKF